MSISSEIQELNANLVAAKGAVEAKGGTAGDTGLAGLATEIATIPSGGGVDPNQKNVVRFIDYDGTVVKRIPLDEASGLASLPEIPTHEGLTGIGWTHSLATIKSATHPLDVGAMYENAVNPAQTIFFMLPRVNEVVTLNFNQSVANGVTIDWGDGLATETVAGEGDVTATHTYATINASSTPLKLTLTPGDGVNTTLGCGTYDKNMFNNGSSGYFTVVGAIFGNGEISDCAFYGCHSLSSVVIPNSVATIGTSAFYNCYSLSSVVLPNSVTSIGATAFASCSTLSSIVIPNSVTSSLNGVFNACKSLSSVVIPDSMTKIQSYMFTDCQSLSSVVIPNSVTTFGEYVFRNCYNLSSVEIPNSVPQIPGSTFLGCSSLSSLVIPNSVTSIGSDAFSGCFSLSSIVIPNSVTSLKSNVFQNCHSLSSIKFEDRETMPNGSGWVFTASGHNPNILDCSEFTQVPTVKSSFLGNMPAYTRILVPASLKANWKAAANWSTYANQIVGV